MLSRNNFGILILSGAVALGAIFFATLSTQSETYSQDDARVVVGTTNISGGASDAGADVDGDGLPTWKETLWGTDPNNPDTDGDGVLDGDEIAAGANPNVEGSEPIVNNDDYVAPRGLTPTEALARELFASYAGVRADGGVAQADLDAELAEILSRRLLEQADAETYTLSSFTSEDDVSLLSYEGSLAQTLRAAGTVREYELNVFARVVGDGSGTELLKLKTTAVVYRGIVEKLLAIEVPTDVASEHLALVNDVSALAAAVDALGDWSGDPLDALALVNNFSAAETGVNESLDRLYTFLNALKKQS